jgi:hypothetical protein
LRVLAEEKINEKVPFNVAAQNELKQLINEVPFDVGYDNIFSDKNGDAIIVDTEFKGEGSDRSIKKLNRYFTVKN